MRENDTAGPQESEAVYYGPCAQCGAVHGGWEACEVLNRPLPYDADVRETLDAYLACAVARVTGDGYDHARHAATKRALDALLGALCGYRARASQADLAAMRRDDANDPADVRACVAERFEPWPTPLNGCAPRPMGDAVVTALQAWYAEKRRTGYDGPGPEQDLYRAVAAATGGRGEVG